MEKKENSALSIVWSHYGKCLLSHLASRLQEYYEYRTKNVVLHNLTEVFIAESNKPKRFSCINQYHFHSFEVISQYSVRLESRPGES